MRFDDDIFLSLFFYFLSFFIQFMLDDIRCGGKGEDDNLIPISSLLSYITHTPGVCFVCWFSKSNARSVWLDTLGLDTSYYFFESDLFYDMMGWAASIWSFFPS